MQNEHRKAYSYIRFSTPDQARGDSYRRQMEAAKRYCDLNGLKWADTSEYLFFDEGRSAFKGQHLGDKGELARFLSYIEEGIIVPGSVLIVENLDRLSRERPSEALPRFLDILKRGVDIYTSMDGKLYTQDVQDFDLLFSIVHMSRAHSESLVKGERVSKAWQQKQANARLSKKPLGKACPYWLSLDDTSYKVIPERIAIIQKIFELAINGHGHRAIAKILNQEGIPAFGSINRNEKSLWSNSSAGKILSNRALLGEYQPTNLVDGQRREVGEPIQDFYPVVISEDKFYQAQAARNIRKVSKATKPTENCNVWQGVAKCIFCGGSMHLVNKGRPPKGGKYLRCYNAAKGVCKGKLITLAQSENVFIEILAKVDSLSLVQGSQSKIKKEISVLDAKLVGVKARLEELQRQMISLEYDIPQMALVAMAKLEGQAKEIADRKNELQRQAQREKIINKRDFISRLDMVTYEARVRANYLLKALDITVDIGKFDSFISYSVNSKKTLNFIITQHGEAIDFIPLGKEAMDTIYKQGDGAAHSAIFDEMNRKLPELGKTLERHPAFLMALDALSNP